MPCPRCGCTVRTFVEPGRWRCSGGSSYPIPGEWSGGPGLTYPHAGPGVIYHPPTTGWAACGTYVVDYRDLDDNERRIHDKAIVSAEVDAVSAEVDAQLPVIAEPGRPSSLPVDVDYIWLSGLVAYWIIGTLALWGILAMAHAQPAKTLAIVIASAVFAGYVAHWFDHHSKLKAAKRDQWLKYERRSIEVVERKEEREELHQALLEALRAKQDTA
jgi:hypothetical protein